MKFTDKVIVSGLSLLAIFYFSSGVALYFFSQQIFESLPEYYGAYNAHFVKDAGLAFSSSAILLLLAIINKPQRLVYSFSASLFVVLHGLFHIQMLLAGMVPGEYLGYELIQIILPASVLFGLVVLIYVVREKA